VNCQIGKLEVFGRKGQGQQLETDANDKKAKQDYLYTLGLGGHLLYYVANRDSLSSCKGKYYRN